MTIHRLAGQPLLFPSRLGLDCFVENKELSTEAAESIRSSFPSGNDLHFIVKTLGWVGNAQRLVEVYSTSAGILLKVEGVGEFLVAPHGEAICKQDMPEDLTNLDREVILGPALVLALALRGVWSLHASAALHRDTTVAFAGESGQGKSTLAAYLSNHSSWRLVADDILPVRLDLDRVNVLPHFPQLKLPVEAQPGSKLPECFRLDKIFALVPVEPDAAPELRQLPPNMAIQMMLRHTAGTRMFTPEMLGEHLSFCSRAAGKISVYELTYPRRKDALPKIKDLLEALC